MGRIQLDGRPRSRDQLMLRSDLTPRSGRCWKRRERRNPLVRALLSVVDGYISPGVTSANNVGLKSPQSFLYPPILPTRLRRGGSIQGGFDTGSIRGIFSQDFLKSDLDLTFDTFEEDSSETR